MLITRFVYEFVEPTINPMDVTVFNESLQSLADVRLLSVELPGDETRRTPAAFE
jgi:hypothetical protein